MKGNLALYEYFWLVSVYMLQAKLSNSYIKC